MRSDSVIVLVGCRCCWGWPTNAFVGKHKYRCWVLAIRLPIHKHCGCARISLARLPSRMTSVMPFYVSLGVYVLRIAERLSSRMCICEPSSAQFSVSQSATRRFLNATINLYEF